MLINYYTATVLNIYRQNKNRYWHCEDIFEGICNKYLSTTLNMLINSNKFIINLSIIFIENNRINRFLFLNNFLILTYNTANRAYYQ